MIFTSRLFMLSCCTFTSQINTYMTHTSVRTHTYTCTSASDATKAYSVLERQADDSSGANQWKRDQSPYRRRRHGDMKSDSKQKGRRGVSAAVLCGLWQLRAIMKWTSRPLHYYASLLLYYCEMCKATHLGGWFFLVVPLKQNYLGQCCSSKQADREQSL